MIFKIFGKLTRAIEFGIVCLLGRCFGIPMVVRYLRNPNPKLTASILRKYGAQIGSRTTFKRSIFIDNSFEDQNSAGDFSHLIVGDNCYIGDCVYFDLADKVVFEDNVVISGKVSFITHADCNRSKILEEKFPRQCAPIMVNSGAWVGFNATILSGVQIGMNSVVASCSLLRQNAEVDTVYAGIPAIKLKSI